MDYQDPRHSTLLPAVVILIILGAVVFFMTQSDQQHAAELPFTRYPSATVKPGPVRQLEGAAAWTFETTDSVEKVLTFHQQNRGDWKLEETSEAGLVLTREGRRLVVAATRAGGKTMLVYTLAETPK